ncbi:MAG: nitroreductase family protein [candidate division KSB1 bacterium]|nr:nitroreductase family protein [candidate division KSB1 bacterium]
MDFMETVRRRHSVRAFQVKPVSEDLLKEIINAGRLAATARNIQPWEFVVVRDPETLASLGRQANYGRFIGSAPACIVVFCQDTKYYLEDGSAAMQNMLLAATALGLGACWVAGDKKEYAGDIRKQLDAPDDYKLIAMMPVGYIEGEPSVKGKRDLADLIHWETF